MKTNADNDATPEVSKPLARELIQELSGDYKERMEEEKTVVVKFKHGQRAEVHFTGFWNGKLVSNAMNAISRSYRLLRYKNIRAGASLQNKVEV